LIVLFHTVFICKQPTNHSAICALLEPQKIILHALFHGNAFAVVLQTRCMKTFFLCFLMLLGAQSMQAQVKKPAKAKKVSTVKKKNPSQQPPGTVRLQSTRTHHAFASVTTATPAVSDPVIRLMNAKPAAGPGHMNGSSLVGVPRGTYGFAGGKLMLYSNTATSTGTTTGSGSVGTGSSPGSIGAFGKPMGVSGISPNATPGTYGIRVPYKLVPDTSRQRQ
jgi:hypothetical protein